MGRIPLHEAGVLLTLALLQILVSHSTKAAPVDESPVSRYTGGKGCYYLNKLYPSGSQIETNEPCLNCTCIGNTLMCYLRVCPSYAKPLGESCRTEKHVGECCPQFWCPEVYPRSTTEKPDARGCYLGQKYYDEGARIPMDPSNPCEVCYCIRNTSVCTIKQCELQVDGCFPEYKPGSCCPSRYNCTAEAATTVPPGVMEPHEYEGCTVGDVVYKDGEKVPSTDNCQDCYCMRHEVVCANQKCTAPDDDCIPSEIEPGQCCPTKYECPNATSADEIMTTTLLTTIPEASIGNTTIREITTYGLTDLPTLGTSDIYISSLFTEQDSETSTLTISTKKQPDMKHMEVPTTKVGLTTISGPASEVSSSAFTTMPTEISELFTLTSLTSNATLTAVDLISRPREAKITEIPDDMFTQAKSTGKPVFFPKGIPGEGICRHKNKTYQNHESVKMDDPCLSCVCINSVVKCEKMNCILTPPESSKHCKEEMLPGECCPKYVCDTPSVTSEDTFTDTEISEAEETSTPLFDATVESVTIMKADAAIDTTASKEIVSTKEEEKDSTEEVSKLTFTQPAISDTDKFTSSTEEFTSTTQPKETESEITKESERQETVLTTTTELVPEIVSSTLPSASTSISTSGTQAILKDLEVKKTTLEFESVETTSPSDTETIISSSSKSTTEESTGSVSSESSTIEMSTLEPTDHISTEISLMAESETEETSIRDRLTSPTDISFSSTEKTDSVSITKTPSDSTRTDETSTQFTKVISAEEETSSKEILKIDSSTEKEETESITASTLFELDKVSHDLSVTSIPQSTDTKLPFITESITEEEKISTFLVPTTTVSTEVSKGSDEIHEIVKASTTPGDIVSLTSIGITDEKSEEMTQEDKIEHSDATDSTLESSTTEISKLSTETMTQVPETSKMEEEKITSPISDLEPIKIEGSSTVSSETSTTEKTLSEMDSSSISTVETETTHVKTEPTSPTVDVGLNKSETTTEGHLSTTSLKLLETTKSEISSTSELIVSESPGEEKISESDIPTHDESLLTAGISHPPGITLTTLSSIETSTQEFQPTETALDQFKSTLHTEEETVTSSESDHLEQKETSSVSSRYTELDETITSDDVVEIKDTSEKPEVDHTEYDSETTYSATSTSVTSDVKATESHLTDKIELEDVTINATELPQTIKTEPISITVGVEKIKEVTEIMTTTEQSISKSTLQLMDEKISNETDIIDTTKISEQTYEVSSTTPEIREEENVTFAAETKFTTASQYPTKSDIELITEKLSTFEPSEDKEITVSSLSTAETYTEESISSPSSVEFSISTTKSPKPDITTTKTSLLSVSEETLPTTELIDEIRTFEITSVDKTTSLEHSTLVKEIANVTTHVADSDYETKFTQSLFTTPHTDVYISEKESTDLSETSTYETSLETKTPESSSPDHRDLELFSATTEVTETDSEKFATVSLKDISTSTETSVDFSSEVIGKKQPILPISETSKSDEVVSTESTDLSETSHTSLITKASVEVTDSLTTKPVEVLEGEEVTEKPLLVTELDDAITSSTQVASSTTQKVTTMETLSTEETPVDEIEGIKVETKLSATEKTTKANQTDVSTLSELEVKVSTQPTTKESLVSTELITELSAFTSSEHKDIFEESSKLSSPTTVEIKSDELKPSTISSTITEESDTESLQTSTTSQIDIIKLDDVEKTKETVFSSIPTISHERTTTSISSDKETSTYITIPEIELSTSVSEIHEETTTTPFEVSQKEKSETTTTSPHTTVLKTDATSSPIPEIVMKDISETSKIDHETPSTLIIPSSTESSETSEEALVSLTSMQTTSDIISDISMVSLEETIETGSGFMPTKETHISTEEFTSSELDFKTETPKPLPLSEKSTEISSLSEATTSPITEITKSLIDGSKPIDITSTSGTSLTEEISEDTQPYTKEDMTSTQQVTQFPHVTKEPTTLTHETEELAGEHTTLLSITPGKMKTKQTIVSEETTTQLNLNITTTSVPEIEKSTVLLESISSVTSGVDLQKTTSIEDSEKVSEKHEIVTTGIKEMITESSTYVTTPTFEGEKEETELNATIFPKADVPSISTTDTIIRETDVDTISHTSITTDQSSIVSTQVPELKLSTSITLETSKDEISHHTTISKSTLHDHDITTEHSLPQSTITDEFLEFSDTKVTTEPIEDRKETTAEAETISVTDTVSLSSMTTKDKNTTYLDVKMEGITETSILPTFSLITEEKTSSDLLTTEKIPSSTTSEIESIETSEKAKTLPTLTTTSSTSITDEITSTVKSLLTEIEMMTEKSTVSDKTEKIPDVKEILLTTAGTTDIDITSTITESSEIFTEEISDTEESRFDGETTKLFATKFPTKDQKIELTSTESTKYTEVSQTTEQTSTRKYASETSTYTVPTNYSTTEFIEKTEMPETVPTSHILPKEPFSDDEKHTFTTPSPSDTTQSSLYKTSSHSISESTQSTTTAPKLDVIIGGDITTTSEIQETTVLESKTPIVTSDSTAEVPTISEVTFTTSPTLDISEILNKSTIQETWSTISKKTSTDSTTLEKQTSEESVDISKKELATTVSSTAKDFSTVQKDIKTSEIEVTSIPTTEASVTIEKSEDGQEHLSETSTSSTDVMQDTETPVAYTLDEKQENLTKPFIYTTRVASSEADEISSDAVTKSKTVEPSDFIKTTEGIFVTEITKKDLSTPESFTVVSVTTKEDEEDYSKQSQFTTESTERDVTIITQDTILSNRTFAADSRVVTHPTTKFITTEHPEFTTEKETITQSTTLKSLPTLVLDRAGAIVTEKLSKSTTLSEEETSFTTKSSTEADLTTKLSEASTGTETDLSYSTIETQKYLSTTEIPQIITKDNVTTTIVSTAQTDQDLREKSKEEEITETTKILIPTVSVKDFEHITSTHDGVLSTGQPPNVSFTEVHEPTFITEASSEILDGEVTTLASKSETSTIVQEETTQETEYKSPVIPTTTDISTPDSKLLSISTGEVSTEITTEKPTETTQKLTQTTEDIFEIKDKTTISPSTISQTPLLSVTKETVLLSTVSDASEDIEDVKSISTSTKIPSTSTLVTTLSTSEVTQSTEKRPDEFETSISTKIPETSDTEIYTEVEGSKIAEDITRKPTTSLPVTLETEQKTSSEKSIADHTTLAPIEIKSGVSEKVTTKASHEEIGKTEDTIDGGEVTTTDSLPLSTKSEVTESSSETIQFGDTTVAGTKLFSEDITTIDMKTTATIKPITDEEKIQSTEKYATTVEDGKSSIQVGITDSATMETSSEHSIKDELAEKFSTSDVDLENVTQTSKLSDLDFTPTTTIATTLSQTPGIKSDEKITQDIPLTTTDKHISSETLSYTKESIAKELTTSVTEIEKDSEPTVGESFASHTTEQTFPVSESTSSTATTAVSETSTESPLVEKSSSPITAEIEKTTIEPEIPLLQDNTSVTVEKSTCTVNGTEYDDGEAIKTIEPCEKCSCTNGEIVCFKIICRLPKIGCTALAFDDHNCCAIQFECPVEGGETETISLTDTQITEKDLSTPIPISFMVSRTSTLTPILITKSKSEEESEITLISDGESTISQEPTISTIPEVSETPEATSKIEESEIPEIAGDFTEEISTTKSSILESVSTIGTTSSILQSTSESLSDTWTSLPDFEKVSEISREEESTTSDITKSSSIFKSETTVESTETYQSNETEHATISTPTVKITTASVTTLGSTESYRFNETEQETTLSPAITVSEQILSNETIDEKTDTVSTLAEKVFITEDIDRKTTPSSKKETTDFSIFDAEMTTESSSEYPTTEEKISKTDTISSTKEIESYTSMEDSSTSSTVKDKTEQEQKISSTTTTTELELTSSTTKYPEDISIKTTFPDMMNRTETVYESTIITNTTEMLSTAEEIKVKTPDEGEEIFPKTEESTLSSSKSDDDITTPLSVKLPKQEGIETSTETLYIEDKTESIKESTTPLTEASKLAETESSTDSPFSTTDERSITDHVGSTRFEVTKTPVEDKTTKEDISTEFETITPETMTEKQYSPSKPTFATDHDFETTSHDKDLLETKEETKQASVSTEKILGDTVTSGDHLIRTSLPVVTTERVITESETTFEDKTTEAISMITEIIQTNQTIPILSKSRIPNSTVLEETTTVSIPKSDVSAETLQPQTIDTSTEIKPDYSQASDFTEVTESSESSSLADKVFTFVSTRFSDILGVTSVKETDVEITPETTTFITSSTFAENKTTKPTFETTKITTEMMEAESETTTPIATTVLSKLTAAPTFFDEDMSSVETEFSSVAEETSTIRIPMVKSVDKELIPEIQSTSGTLLTEKEDLRTKPTFESTTLIEETKMVTKTTKDILVSIGQTESETTSKDTFASPKEDAISTSTITIKMPTLEPTTVETTEIPGDLEEKISEITTTLTSLKPSSVEYKETFSTALDTELTSEKTTDYSTGFEISTLKDIKTTTFGTVNETVPESVSSTKEPTTTTMKQLEGITEITKPKESVTTEESKQEIPEVTSDISIENVTDLISEISSSTLLSHISTTTRPKDLTLTDQSTVILKEDEETSLSSGTPTQEVEINGTTISITTKKDITTKPPFITELITKSSENTLATDKIIIPTESDQISPNETTQSVEIETTESTLLTTETLAAEDSFGTETQTFTSSPTLTYPQRLSPELTQFPISSTFSTGEVMRMETSSEQSSITTAKSTITDVSETQSSASQSETSITDATESSTEHSEILTERKSSTITESKDITKHPTTVLTKSTTISEEEIETSTGTTIIANFTEDLKEATESSIFSTYSTKRVAQDETQTVSSKTTIHSTVSDISEEDIRISTTGITVTNLTAVTELPTKAYKAIETTQSIPTTPILTTVPEETTEEITTRSVTDFLLDEGACIFDGRIYQSAEQILREDPCEFCFCFRGDIICLQQSCPPPALNCHRTEIQGFCCPRYDCPVLVTSQNVTSVMRRKGVQPIIIQKRIDKRSVRLPAEVKGCDINGTFYEVGATVTSASWPCLHCVCEDGGNMHCDPRKCKPQAPFMLNMNNSLLKRR